MASTYSNLKFELIGTGDQSGAWGTTTNTNLGTAIEQALVGMATISSGFVANSLTLTLTDTNAAQNARALVLNLTQALSGAGTLNVPAIQKPYMIINATGQTVTVKVTGLTGVAVPNGTRTFLYNNGTDVGVFENYFPSLTLGAALPITSGGTGTTSTTFVNLTTNVTGTLPIANGGTGTTSSTFVNLATNVTGTLPVANGGTGGATQAAARTGIGATTVGSNFFTLTNPSATTFPQMNADNTVSALDAATFRTAIGAGTGAGTVTAVSVASANGFAGSSSGGATPALTLSTTISGVLKGNGTAISAAVSGTDYAPATSGSSILYGNSAGGFSNVTIGSGLSFASGTLSSTASVSAATATTLGTVYGRMDTSGKSLVALGYNAAAGNSNGYSCVAIGFGALQTSQFGSQNTAVGYQALYSNQNASNSTAVGYWALNANTGAYNTAVGSLSLYQNTTATANTAIGYSSLQGTTTGGYNTAVGYAAAQSISGGTQNTACGAYALYNGSSNDNTAVGYSALGGGPGIRNVGVGYFAGNNINGGTYNVCIGYTSTSAAADNYEIVIGSSTSAITGKGSSTGFISPNGGGVYQGNNSSSWSTTSDRRLKKNIVDNTEGLDRITAIQVRNFEYRLPEEVTELDPSCAVKKDGVQLGVIAQELQQVCPDCVKEESTGVLSVDSDNVFWHMVNSIKQLKSELDTVKAELAALKGA